MTDNFQKVLTDIDHATDLDPQSKLTPEEFEAVQQYLAGKKQEAIEQGGDVPFDHDEVKAEDHPTLH